MRNVWRVRPGLVLHHFHQNFLRSQRKEPNSEFFFHRRKADQTCPKLGVVKRTFYNYNYKQQRFGAIIDKITSTEVAIRKPVLHGSRTFWIRSIDHTIIARLHRAPLLSLWAPSAASRVFVPSSWIPIKMWFEKHVKDEESLLAADGPGRLRPFTEAFLRKQEALRLVQAFRRPAGNVPGSKNKLNSLKPRSTLEATHLGGAVTDVGFMYHIYFHVWLPNQREVSGLIPWQMVNCHSGGCVLMWVGSTESCGSPVTPGLSASPQIPYLHKTYSQRTPHIHSGHVPTLIQQNLWLYRSQSNRKNPRIFLWYSMFVRTEFICILTTKL